MADGLTYRIEFTQKEVVVSGVTYDGQTITCDIYDTSTIGGPLDGRIVNLIPGSVPCKISVIDNDENKFTSIRAKQCTLQFLSTNDVNLSTFITDSADNRFKVKVYSPVETIFFGFIVLNDIRQEFMDNFTYRTVELTATDGLGLLKDIPLTKPDNTNPKGYNYFINYITWCLLKTGLQIPINVMNNLMLVDVPDLPAYDFAMLQAKTFEEEIGTSINCYSVLQRILGEECFLTQWKGEWWIRRIDEYEGDTQFYDAYNSVGIYQATHSLVSQLNKEIGLNKPITLTQPAALVSAERPHLFAKEKYDFEFPREIIDNFDFSRGALINDLGTEKWYNVDDWTLLRGFPGSPIANDSTTYIKRLFDANGYEKERYVVITSPSAQNVETPYIESNPLPVSGHDKFDISVDFRFPTNITGGGTGQFLILVVRLLGDDGTHWWLGHAIDSNGNYTSPTWYQTNSTWTSFTFMPGPAIGLQFNGSLDTSTWQHTSWEAPQCPVDGNIYIQLHGFNPSGASWDNVDVYYSNLSFTYIPFINGSYQKYNGQYNKVFRTGGYKATIDNTVYVSDSPKKLFKGAILRLNTLAQPILAGLWYNGAVPFIRALNGTDPQYNHPLGYIQAFSVWNQYRRSMRLFDCSFDGLESNIELPDLMHTYFIRDNSPHTNGKHFMLLHFEMDLYRCTWQGYLAEVYDDNNQKVYSDSFEFKYITG